MYALYVTKSKSLKNCLKNDIFVSAQQLSATQRNIGQLAQTHPNLLHSCLSEPELKTYLPSNNLL